MHNKKTLLIAFSLILLMALAAIAQDKFMPVSEVKQGMKGFIRTTFTGTEVVEVEAEVLGVLPNVIGPDANIIIIKLKGEKIEFNGVANGMSGSPFFIDGKLVGAAAYRLANFPKEPIAGVTPIREMLETQFGGPGAPRLSVDYHPILSSSDDLSRLSDKLGYKVNPEKPLSSRATALVNGLIPMTASFSYAGADPRAIAPLAEILKNNGIELVSSSFAGNSSKPIAGDLTPGMPVAVPLVMGDMYMGSSGTVTHIDGKKVWAFGHPFNQMGNVDYPMARAEMITVLTSLMGSNNLVRNGQLIGAITQDRSTAIFGELGKTADTLPLKIDITYKGEALDSFNFQIARDVLLTPNLINLVVSNSLFVSQSQIGDLSARITGSMDIEGYPSVKIDNFYSGITTINSISGLPAAIYMFIANNTFDDPRITGMNLKIDIAEELKLVELHRAWLTKTEIKPGENFKLNIEMRPKRGNVYRLTEEFFIPPTMQEGTYRIIVGDGNAIGAAENRMVNGQIKLKNLEHMIRIINTMRSNFKLYAMTYREEEGVLLEGDFFPNLPPSALSVVKSNKAEHNFVGLSGTILDERKIETEYQVSGNKVLTFKIKR